jgi:hypothetical protein
VQEIDGHARHNRRVPRWFVGAAGLVDEGLTCRENHAFVFT